MNKNRIEALPPELKLLSKLETLSLHDNRLESLPAGFLSFVKLRNISLRDNPLCSRFVRDHAFEVPSLLELAGRAVKHYNMGYGPRDIPRTLVTYLDSAKCCDNPKCRGVYFSSHVRHVKFVDFCGKYSLPLMHFLCSECLNESSGSSGSEDEEEEAKKLKKVLLG